MCDHLGLSLYGDRLGMRVSGIAYNSRMVRQKHAALNSMVEKHPLLNLQPALDPIQLPLARLPPGSLDTAYNKVHDNHSHKYLSVY